MAKGDDALRKKANKANRKKLRNDSSTVSARVASIIASKRRRKAGKRRMCEGMCFSLPTPEDPFNDKNEKKAFNKRKPKKCAPQQVDRGVSLAKKVFEVSEKVEQRDLKKEKNTSRKDEQNKVLAKKGVVRAQQGLYENLDCLSKFLILCLNAIQNAWLHDGAFDENVGRPLLANTWGVEFWKCCSAGSNILDTSGACANKEQIAWLVSTASDIVTRKEKEGLSVANPFLLYLVPSQEKAIKVRSVCKPLKALGIHTVSLHPGASIDHQVHGLRSCEPEFLVSTPERLVELVSLGAIDISGVSLLVLDGLESFVDGGVDSIKSIRQFVSGDPQKVFFSDCYESLSTSLAQNLFEGPICRLCTNDSITRQSASISQCV